MINGEESARAPSPLARNVLLFVFGVIASSAIVFLAHSFYIELVKYDSVYKSINIEPLPKGIENVPLIQADLVALVRAPCNRAALEALADDLASIGQQPLGRLVSQAMKRCVPHRGVIASGSGPEVGLPTTLASLRAGGEPELANIAEQLQENLCSQPAVVRALALLHGKNAIQSALVIGGAFLSHCRADALIGFYTLKSQYWLGNFTQALALFDAFKAEYADNLYFMAWGGYVLEKLNRPSDAADAFLASLSLWPHPETVNLSEFTNVSRNLAAAGRACEAVPVLLKYVSYDPKTRQTPQTAAVIADLSKSGNCPPG